MELTQEKVAEFMRTLLGELNREAWGDIDPHWLVHPNVSGDTTGSVDEEEHLSLKQCFTEAFKKFTT